jgi:2,6-dihydroxypseudooxynicotine hydrolase
MAKAHAFLDPTAERIEAPLGDATLAGNLRRPGGAERPPLVVLVPGLDSTKEEFFHWENSFLARGMATLSMDGPGQGETGFRLPIRHDYEVAVAAMLDALGTRTDVDLGRVGAAGVSLGGYYAPRAAAFEPRIRAVAGISGSYNFGEVWDQLPPLTREAFAVKSGARDADEARANAEALDLAGVLDNLTQPALYVTGGLDRIIPWRQTERAARETPNGTFVLYENGTHVCSNIPYRYRPLVADWMWDQLNGRGG